MRQLVEADQRDLRALQVRYRLVVLEVGEADGRSGWERPRQIRRHLRIYVQAGIELLALVPEAALVSYLH
ncbi:hypothetical protein D3C71_2081680 [compost metagenome]